MGPTPPSRRPGCGVRKCASVGLSADHYAALDAVGVLGLAPLTPDVPGALPASHLSLNEQRVDTAATDRVAGFALRPGVCTPSVPGP